MLVPPTEAATILEAAIRDPGFRRGTFGGVPRAVSHWQRVIVRPLMLRGQSHWQFNYFDAKKHITKNYSTVELAGPLAELIAFQFSGIHLETAEEEFDLRTSKKGQIHLGRKKVRRESEAVEPHNRVKDLPLPEGKADALLETMGILTADGKVKSGMRGKFAQINEFLKQLMIGFESAGLRDECGTTLRVVIPAENVHSNENKITTRSVVPHLLSSPIREISILDCGCGSSYLTLAVHHYLNDVLAIPARIVGVDVNEEVIRKSIAKAHALGAEGATFALGRIGELNEKPDIVLALHACDTATDDALAQAVRGEAKLILSVPCCHHHLNAQLRAEGPHAEAMRPLLRHGILHERTADILTDSFRALALRILGYKTDVIEFVSSEHTARNLMIRAIRGLPVGEPAFVKEYRELKALWGVVPYLEEAMPGLAECVR